jgi:nucleoside 2-deoxyribosyltransferase
LSRPIRVYIAGPLTVGDPLENAIKAMEVGALCKAAGLAPYVPHLSHFWNEHFPDEYEGWMELDFAWLGACDVLLRLPGESPGAEREVKQALAMGIPVYSSLPYMLKELARESIH